MYAKRIGTAIERLSEENTPDWKNDHRLNVLYGDPTNQPGSKSYMQLIPKEQSLYCINSKGKSVPVEEIGWGDTNDKPTHLFLRVSSSYGRKLTLVPVGNKLWVDNVRLAY